MTVFKVSDYKKALKDRLERLKKQNKQFCYQNMANHCRIQKTYLSRVLSRDDTHLTSDQLYLALEFLGFSPIETQYIECLYDFRRSQIPKRREALQRELSQLREKHLKTETHLSVTGPEVTQEQWHNYYLNPDVQLIHMFLTIPRFARLPELIQEHLGLSSAAFRKAIETLLRLQVIDVKKDGYEVRKNKLHLPVDSPLSLPYKQLLRMRAAEKIRSLNSQSSYNFSVIFTATPKERAAIQEEFLKFLKKAEKLVEAATPEEVYQMNFDLFEWSKDAK
jgi:uncharacterized protein (TIGR02147 family)